MEDHLPNKLAGAKLSHPGASSISSLPLEIRAKPCRVPERSENPSRQGFSFLLSCSLSPASLSLSLLGVRHLLKAGAKPLEIPDEPIQFYVQISPCLLSRYGRCTNPFCCRSGSWKAISFRSGSTLFSILRSKAKTKQRLFTSPRRIRRCLSIYHRPDEAIGVCVGGNLVSGGGVVDCVLFDRRRRVSLALLHYSASLSSSLLGEESRRLFRWLDGAPRRWKTSISLSTAELDEAKDGSDQEDINVRPTDQDT
ncbi:hypothetical protein DY000_02038834 [Brassica cretica]|uniref:Uncharacterized protein n=1 Tax=Brassica cretica TaxID=69181 RepID=A0ABQ7BJ32_BRACR|nr:hypothetical protein DY000_02038834 [Brassica cretica]